MDGKVHSDGNVKNTPDEDSFEKIHKRWIANPPEIFFSRVKIDREDIGSALDSVDFDEDFGKRTTPRKGFIRSLFF